MMRALVGAVLLGLVAVPFIALEAAPGDAAREEMQRDAFFQNGKVIHLKIEIDKAELESLRREPRKYVRAILREGDLSIREAGIHVKGAAGSWRGIDDKPGLTLNMDKFRDDQRFRGMDKFHLANSVQDPSYLSELLCGELMRAAGVPAARIGHAVVTINGRPRGLYYLKEGYDQAFLEKHFGSSDGNFYDGGFLRDIDQPLELIRTRKDVADRADLKSLAAAAREPDRARRFQKLETLLELEVFISYMVVEALAWDWDGYPFKCNNYRVYHHPVKDKITFIPSGMDQMFADVNGPVLPDFGGMVARGLIDTPEGRKRYIARAKEIMAKVYKTNDLLKRLDQLEKRIQPELAKVDPNAGRDYKNQVNRLRSAIREREKVVNEQLKKLK